MGVVVMNVTDSHQAVLTAVAYTSSEESMTFDNIQLFLGPNIIIVPIED